MSDPKPPAPDSRPASRRSPWPWVILALWVAWVAILAWLGRSQWGVPRDGAAETPVPEKAPR